MALETYETSEENIRLVTEPAQEFYFVSIGPATTGEERDQLDELLDLTGLEMMDEDECPCHREDDGTLVIWCAEKVPSHFPQIGGLRWEG